MTIRRIALAGAMCVAWSVMNPGHAFACSCIQPGSPLEELDRSALVFSGTVVSVREDKPLMGIDAFPSNGPTTVDFKVHEVWKGQLPPNVSLTTAKYGASCGFTFVEGLRYIVYSRDGETVSLCSRTRLLQGADEDLTELGKRDGGAWGPASLPGPKGSSQSPELTQPSSTKGAPTVAKEAQTTAGGACAAPLRPGHATGDLALLGLLAGLIAVGHRQRCQGRRNVGPSRCRSSGEMCPPNGQESVPRASEEDE